MTTEAKYDIFSVSVHEYKSYRSGYRNRYPKFLKRVVVYVEIPEAERPGMQDILADFAWRRTHEAPLPNKTVGVLIAPILRSQGYELTGLPYYSRKAGCSMCPCSPGYLVPVRDYQAYDRTNIHLTHSDIEKRDFEKQQKRSSIENENKEIAGFFGVNT